MNPMVAAAPQERLVFANTVEALFVQGLKGRLDAKAVAELRAIGLDIERKLLPGYPAEVFARGCEIAARRAYPSLTLAKAYWALGERTVFGLEETLLGKAQVAMSKLVGPLRALERMPRSMAMGSTHSRCTVNKLSANRVEVHVTGYALPHVEFEGGALNAVLVMTGAREPSVELLAFDARAETCAYRLGWS